jgi:hypothetical protein
MGTSRSPAEFVGKINKIGQATDKARKSTVSDGAFAAKKVMLGAAAAKGVMLGGKIAGRKWNVTYDVRGGEVPVALVRFTGPFHLVNNDTKAHYVVARGLGGNRESRGTAAVQASASRFSGDSAAGAFGGQRRGRGRRALNINGNIRAYAFHPGTSGKGIFQAAKPIAARTVPGVMAASMKGAWRRAAS